MKRALIVALVISLFSCEPVVKTTDATVDRVQGLPVFILSEPKTEFEVLGIVNNNMAEQFGDNTKGKKKFGDIVEGIFSTASDNANFQKLLNNMATMTKEQHPEADAILFEYNLSQGTAIKFKEKQ